MILQQSLYLLYFLLWRGIVQRILIWDSGELTAVRVLVLRTLDILMAFVLFFHILRELYFCIWMLSPLNFAKKGLLKLWCAVLLLELLMRPHFEMISCFEEYIYMAWVSVDLSQKRYKFVSQPLKHLSEKPRDLGSISTSCYLF